MDALTALFQTARRCLVVAVATVLAACASPNPALYVLAPVTGGTHAGAPRTIEIRRVSIARYLERSQIVRSSEGYRIDVLGNDWWGEPLDAMMSRVLVQELNQRLRGSSVFGDSGAISARPDRIIEVNLQRFDLNQQQEVLLVAQISTDAKNDRPDNVVVTVKPVDATTQALVAAMSGATGQLADRIARILAGR